MRRYSLTHKLPQIIERDGGEWKCHYCGKNLIPSGTPRDAEPYYGYVLAEYDPPAIKDYNSPTWEQDYEAFLRGDLRYWVGFYVASNDYSWPQVDHVIPLSKGGTNHLSNLVTACNSCNNHKSDKSYEDFVREIQSGQS